MRRIAIVAALLLASAANAQTLYKCVSSNNSTSYQQARCPRTARLVRTMETTPEPPLTPDQIAEQTRKAQRDREESAFLSHLAGTDQMRSAYRTSRNRSSGYGAAAHRSAGGSMSRISSRLDPQADGCKAATATRVNVLRAAGLHRTFDLLRQLDADVEESCNKRR